jgi:hypothetical protein
LIFPSLARAFGDSERCHVRRDRTALLFGKHRHDADGQPIAMGMPAAVKGRTMCLDGGNAEGSRPRRDNTWSEFALVARDLGGKKPLETIPLASRIAGATVEAFEQR